MPLLSICRYADQHMYGAGPCTPDGSMILTGHHIIPDHCFYFTSGLRGMGDLSAFLCPGVVGYTTADAPVIMVTADPNGGKSQMHGTIHVGFDPVELSHAHAQGNEWTYAQARQAAVNSVFAVCGVDVTAALDHYFVHTLGLTDATIIRAGEQGTMTSAPAPRRSARNT